MIHPKFSWPNFVRLEIKGSWGTHLFVQWPNKDVFGELEYMPRICGSRNDLGRCALNFLWHNAKCPCEFVASSCRMAAWKPAKMQKVSSWTEDNDWITSISCPLNPHFASPKDMDVPHPGTPWWSKLPAMRLKKIRASWFSPYLVLITSEQKVSMSSL